jgi:hypothetical protein
MGADRIPLPGHEWEDDVIELRGEMHALRGDMTKLECTLRSDMGRMESGLRADMVKLESGLRGDISRLETTLLKWSFLFWIGQVIAMSGIMGVLLRARP